MVELVLVPLIDPLPVVVIVASIISIEIYDKIYIFLNHNNKIEFGISDLPIQTFE